MTTPLISRRSLLAGTATVFATMVPRAMAAPFQRERIGDAPILMERGFVKVSYGQLHYRRAAPLDKKQIKHRPVICFHQTPNSSQIYVEFMAELARDRIVYAVDIPGLGESDLPENPPEICDYATAMREFIEAKDLGKVDLVGYHTGASVAAELALRHSEQVGGLMLVGLALFNAGERKGFFDQPWPKPAQANGGHLQPSWQSSFKWRGAGQSDASVKRTFVQKTSAGETAWWGARAVMRHDLAATLKSLKSPYFVVNSSDDLVKITPRLADIRPDIKIVSKTEFGFGIFEVDSKSMAVLAADYFDHLQLPAE